MFVNFPADFPDTSTHYGKLNADPFFATYRGKYRLGHQCQQIRRDLFAEQRDRLLSRGLRYYETDAEYRKRLNCPYLFLVNAYGEIPVTAFRTQSDFEAWLDAYGLTLDGGKIVASGRPMLPLTCKPVLEG